MLFIPQLLRARLENLLDAVGLEGFVAELANVASKRGWVEIRPEDLAAFLLRTQPSSRIRALIRSYKVDLRALPPFRQGDGKVEALTWRRRLSEFSKAR